MSIDEDPQDIIEHLNTGSELKVIPQTNEGHSLPSPDPELTPALEDMKRRYRVTREKLQVEDDAPGAS
ncbi:MAG: hypothetical protein WKF74_16850 [Pyrinomonadaceae bacterium]